MSVKWGAVLVAALTMVGCASITRGTDEPVTFDSDPPGAEMRSMIINPCGQEGVCASTNSSDQYAVVDRRDKPGPTCVTPCTLPIKRSDDLMVTFTKEGYLPKTVKLARFVPGAGGAGVAGNILVGGAIGVMTDAATGAAYDHTPNPLKVALEPVSSAKPPVRARRR